MAKPAAVVSWATDTNLATGTESGLSTKLEPSAGVKAQGHVPGENAPGRWSNWLHNLLGQWTSYLNNLENETAFLDANFAWTGDHTFANTGLVTVDANAVFSGSVDSSGVTAISHASGLFLNSVAGQVAYSPARSTTKLHSLDGWTVDTGSLDTLPLKGPNSVSLQVGALTYNMVLAIPSGCTLIDVSAGVLSAVEVSAQAKITVYRHTPDFVAPFLSGSLTSLGSDTAPGSGANVLSVTVSEVIANATQRYIVQWATSDNAGTAQETLYWLKYTFTDVGPRNG